MTQNKTRYGYIRDPENPRRVITLAYEIAAETLPYEKRPRIYFGWAVCRPEDQFEKKKGRTIALGRLTHSLTHSRRTYWAYADEKNKNFMVSISQQILNVWGSEIPNFMHRSFRAYLNGQEVRAPGAEAPRRTFSNVSLVV